MPLAADAIAALATKSLTLATAEATTGGLIGHLLTEIPGSSRVFRGGVAPYANSLKETIGVPASLLAEYGTVSREAAEALAIAVREWANADVGLAETGIAGPGSAEPDHPAGLFWIALADAGELRSERFVFEGDRSENRRACVEAALRMLLDRLSAT
jgi:PncC family amidohydrolase